MERNYSPITYESPPPIHGGRFNYREEECDLCHDWFPLPRWAIDRPSVRYTGRQFLCPRCAAE